MLGVCGLALSSLPGHARAQVPAVAITVDPCVPVDHDKLRRLLAIELGGVRVDARAASTRVMVSCAPRGISLRLDDTLTHKSMERLLPAASFRDASSTRLLALATAEFVVASWIELRVRRPTTAALAPGPRPELSARAEAIVNDFIEPEAFEQSVLSASFHTRLWTAQRTGFFGANVRWLRGVESYLALTAAAEFGMGNARVQEGSVSAITAAVSIAIALQTHIDRWELSSGPGASVGLANLSGRERTPELRGAQFAALYGGVLWFTHLGYRAGTRLRLGLDIEAAWTTLPVHGDAPAPAPTSGESIPVFELDGLSLALNLGVGWAL